MSQRIYFLGAGLATWGSIDFVESQAANPSFDFISLRVYPWTGKARETAVDATDIAHHYHACVMLDAIANKYWTVVVFLRLF